MLTLYDHIQEVRRELRGCIMTKRERAEAEKDLANSLARLAEIEAEHDAIFEITRDEAG